MSLLRSLRWYAAHPNALILRGLGAIYERFYPDEPWISWRAVRFCEENLVRDMTALEWGSGRSTCWYGKHVKSLTSIEHHAGWFGEIHKKIKALALDHIDYRFIPLDHPVEMPCEIDYNPLPKYVAVVREFADLSLDFIVVDGHYRQTCVKEAIPALKSGGLLLVDNSNWMPLHEWGVPHHWPVVHRSFGFYGETTIWKKP